MQTIFERLFSRSLSLAQRVCQVSLLKEPRILLQSYTVEEVRHRYRSITAYRRSITSQVRILQYTL
jgi:hypothetical protein